MNLWNDKNLPIPPIDTYKAVDNNIDIQHLNNVFEDGKNVFNHDIYLSAEYAVMSRVVYRTKQKFRTSKDFKALYKIQRSLDNYFQTNISSHLQNFIDLIPLRYTKETYLPNKNLLDYILVRLQGLAKLMERIVETCKIAAYLFEKRIHTGHFWRIAVIIFSIVSRIYVLVKYKAKFVCDFYSKLLPFSRLLKNSGRNWLPDNYVLPTDLQKWINVDWLDIDDELQIIEPSEFSQIIQLFDLAADEDDIQVCDEYVMVDDEEDTEFDHNHLTNRVVLQNLNVLRGFETDEEIGEVIEINDNSLLPDEYESVNKGIEVLNDTGISNNLPNSKVEGTSSIDVGEVIEIDDNILNANTQENCESTNDVIVIENSELNMDKASVSCEIISDDSCSSLVQIPNKKSNYPDFIEFGSETSFVTLGRNKKQKKRDGIRTKNNNRNKVDKKSLTKKEIKKSSRNNSAIHETTDSDRDEVIIISDSSRLHKPRNITNGTGVKRKSDDIAQSSHKKSKTVHSATKELPQKKMNRKKNKVIKNQQLEVVNPKHNYNSRDTSQANGNHSRKDRLNKSEKTKQLVHTVHTAKKGQHLKHVKNEFKANYSSRKKEKTRYFM